jgi:hypothetical protein
MNRKICMRFGVHILRGQSVLHMLTALLGVNFGHFIEHIANETIHYLTELR